jgi:uncharacterized protein
MKPLQHVVLVATALLLLSACSAPSLQGQTTPRLITTSGEADVLVVPDEVILTLGVETSSLDLSLAKQQNDQRVAKVLAAAQARGVPERYLQTEHISIEPRYRDSYQQDFAGYFVRKIIVITLKDVPSFDAVLSDALQAGAGYVYGIEFRTTELRTHRDEARALAIGAAHEKAVALARELGQKVGQPHDIHEDQSQWSSWYNSWWSGRAGSLTQNVIQESSSAAAETDGALAPGQISVSAKVTVSFELK